MNRLLSFCVSAVALLAAAEDCENDELQLLQMHEKFPDWSKILEAGAKGADALSGGIGKVTSQIGDAITTLDSQVMQAEGLFNASLSKFNKACNATTTVSQNLTEFKFLIGNTVEKYAPFYVSAVEQVQTAVKTTKAILGLMGQKDLINKLEDLNQTAVEKLGDLADASEALSSEVMETSHEKYGDIVEDMKGKLDAIVGTTGSFQKSFNKKLEAFTASLQGPLELALGAEASTQILNLQTKAQKMVKNLNTFAQIVKMGLASAADDVDTQVANVKKKGFFSRIFGGFFR